jgi:hypothetical protein
MILLLVECRNPCLRKVETCFGENGLEQFVSESKLIGVPRELEL